jgi:hypothetical protein
MLPAKFGSIWPSCFRGEVFLTLANQKKKLILAAMFVGRTPPSIQDGCCFFNVMIISL